MSIFPKPYGSRRPRVKRPRCPECGEELVFAALVVPGGEAIYRAWVCDCQYRESRPGPDGREYHDLDFVPRGIINQILHCRESDEGAFVMRIRPRESA
jgi:hypothetical protein